MKEEGRQERQQIGPYRKTTRAKVNVGEARSLAFSATYPALLAARWALAVSVMALIVAGLAFWRTF